MTKHIASVNVAGALASALIFAIGALVVCILSGCVSQSVKDVRRQIQEEHNSVDKQIAATNDRLDQAEADPVKHPILAAESMGKESRSISKLGLGVSVLVLIVAGALLFYSPLSWLSKILLPLGAAGAALCFFGIVASPFLFNPWFFIPAGAGAAVLIVWEVVSLLRKYKTPAAAMTAVAADVKADVSAVEAAVQKV